MPTIPARSPVLRLVRNLCLLWAALSVLALLAALGLVIHAMGWSCTDPAANGGLSWVPCVLSRGIGVLAALSSLAVAVVVLFFAQLFYVAGAEVRQSRSRGWKLFGKEAIADAVLDASDIGEGDGDGGDGGD